MTRPTNTFARVGRPLLVAYWAGCLAVIGVGVDRIYPDLRPALIQAPATQAVMSVAAPAARYDRPFRNCAAAHAAGVYDIPASSAAYSEHQDGDSDGLACEPIR